MDMKRDLFANNPAAKAALAKIKPTSPNFRVYCIGWMETGGGPDTWDTVEVIGAEFRAAKSGPFKGQLSIMVPGTRRTAYVNKSEFQKSK